MPLGSAQLRGQCLRRLHETHGCRAGELAARRMRAGSPAQLLRVLLLLLSSQPLSSKCPLEVQATLAQAAAQKRAALAQQRG